MLVAPAGDVTVEPIEEERERRHGGGGVEMRLGSALQKPHREQHRGYAACCIGERKEISEMEPADHRKMRRPRALRHGHQHTKLPACWVRILRTPAYAARPQTETPRARRGRQGSESPRPRRGAGERM